MKRFLEETLKESMEGFLATFLGAINDSLAKYIMGRKKLASALTSMVKGKVPGHDEIPIKFFQQLWPTIGHDFHQMIIRNIERGTLHEGVIKGLIGLIPKEGDAKDLNYWRPIILLLIINYKLITKTLQLRLHSILRDIINMEQMALLPLHVIVLTHETLHWAKSEQPSIFLNLDFSKAYDKS